MLKYTYNKDFGISKVDMQLYLGRFLDEKITYLYR
ncbi:hypothetical protein X924_10100 [Petrotoga sp. 9PWA.NaAc.5.4]|nr:hypothetical protein X924_10100 [Petrotoga sp. 9PWA.NaAc.5.4]